MLPRLLDKLLQKRLVDGPVDEDAAGAQAHLPLVEEAGPVSKTQRHTTSHKRDTYVIQCHTSVTHTYIRGAGRRSLQPKHML